MNKILQSIRNRKQDKLIFIQAGITTVFFYLVLLFLFSAAMPPNIANIKSSRGISMLALEGKNVGKNKSILTFLYYSNPTYFTKPNHKFGYSNLFRQQEFSVPQQVPVDLDRRFKKAEYEMTGFSTKSNPIEKKRFDVNVPSISWDYNTLSPPVPLFTKKTKVPLNYPLWKNAQGEELPQLFQKIKEVNSKVTQLKPSSSTVLNVSFEGNEFFPGTKVIKSCGVSELDRLAIRQLLRNYKKIDFKNGKTNKGQTLISIEWCAQ